MPATAFPRPVRHGQSLTYDDLRREAAKAVATAAEEGVTQKSIADALEVTPPAITHALKTPGTRYATLQARIIGYLTGYQVETEIVMRVVRKK